MTAESYDENVINYTDANTVCQGPCWCDDDQTTGGHYHGPVEPIAREWPPTIYGNDSARNERKAIFNVLIEIRDILKGST